MENLYELDSFHNFTIPPLTQEERKLFIRKQFPSDNQHIANIIINKLSEKKNIQYHQLLNTPLLIILCILNFQYNRDLPLKKSEFYGRVFDALYQGHDWRSKTGFERTRRCKLMREDYISILEIFSFYTHFKSIFLFSKECIFEVFNSIYKYEYCYGYGHYGVNKSKISKLHNYCANEHYYPAEHILEHMQTYCSLV